MDKPISASVTMRREPDFFVVVGRDSSSVDGVHAGDRVASAELDDTEAALVDEGKLPADAPVVAIVDLIWHGTGANGSFEGGTLIVERFGALPGGAVVHARALSVVLDLA